MAQKLSRFESRRKPAAPSNPMILGARFAAWIFWSMVAIIGVMIVGAIYWLLAHPLTA